MELRCFVEHTMLKPEATEADIAQTVDDAIRYGFFGICVAPIWVKFAHTRLSDIAPTTAVQVVSVVGFPHGNGTTLGKVADANKAIECGASEIDMVMQIGRLKSGDHKTVVTDISCVTKVCKQMGANAIKVILETGFLSAEEIISACRLAESAGADFVKTSTGFGPRGASVEDVQLMKTAVGTGLRIKAAGGIRTKEAAMTMIEAGACRIGTSSSVQIVTGAVEREVANAY
jgi:deoxyribose-phosphate aldolase